MEEARFLEFFHQITWWRLTWYTPKRTNPDVWDHVSVSNGQSRWIYNRMKFKQIYIFAPNWCVFGEIALQSMNYCICCPHIELGISWGDLWWEGTLRNHFRKDDIGLRKDIRNAQKRVKISQFRPPLNEKLNTVSCWITPPFDNTHPLDWRNLELRKKGIKITSIPLRLSKTLSLTKHSEM